MNSTEEIITVLCKNAEFAIVKSKECEVIYIDDFKKIATQLLDLQFLKPPKSAEEFLINWKKENNTEDAVYSHYHIDAMEAYASSNIRESQIKKEREQNIRFYAREYWETHLGGNVEMYEEAFKWLLSKLSSLPKKELSDNNIKEKLEKYEGDWMPKEIAAYLSGVCISNPSTDEFIIDFCNRHKIDSNEFDRLCRYLSLPSPSNETCDKCDGKKWLESGPISYCCSCNSEEESNVEISDIRLRQLAKQYTVDLKLESPVLENNIKKAFEWLLSTLSPPNKNKGEWISVEERLPEEGAIVDVIMMNGKREIDVNFTAKEKGYNRWFKFKDPRLGTDVKTLFLVTHWTPSPESPIDPHKEEENK